MYTPLREYSIRIFGYEFLTPYHIFTFHFVDAADHHILTPSDVKIISSPTAFLSGGPALHMAEAIAQPAGDMTMTEKFEVDPKYDPYAETYVNPKGTLIQIERHNEDAVSVHVPFRNVTFTPLMSTLPTFV